MSDLSQGAKNAYLFKKTNRINGWVDLFYLTRDGRPRIYGQLEQPVVIMKRVCEICDLFIYKNRMVNRDPHRPISWVCSTSSYKVVKYSIEVIPTIVRAPKIRKITRPKDTPVIYHPPVVRRYPSTVVVNQFEAIVKEREPEPERFHIGSDGDNYYVTEEQFYKILSEFSLI